MATLNKRTIEILTKHGFKPIKGELLESIMVNLITSIAEEFDDIMSPVTSIDPTNTEPKEPELMTLQEAFKKAGDKDLISYFDEPELRFTKKDHYHVIMSGKQALGIRWYVIPEKPKVLTADKFFENYPNINCKGCEKTKPGDCPSLEFKCDDIVYSFNNGDKNGQLKQWLNYKEPMDAFNQLLQKAKSYMENHDCNDFTAYIEHSEKTLKNLKPLKAE